MPQVDLQQINLGSYANDGTGDDLRTAFEKVNANFGQIQSAIPIKIEEDPDPKLGGNLNLNGRNLFSGQPVVLNSSKFTVSGDIQATKFVGQISDLSNHSLIDLRDVDYEGSPNEGDGLVFKISDDGRPGRWQPGTVNAAIATIDGGAASSIFNDEEGSRINGGDASTR
jgi:hypothetical protein